METIEVIAATDSPAVKLTGRFTLFPAGLPVMKRLRYQF